MAKVAADKQAKDAQIASDHDAEMKKLLLKKEEQDKELELAKQKAEAEIQIKLLVADADAKIEKDKLTFEIECERHEREEKMKDKAKEEQMPLMENAMPAFVEALKAVTETFAKALQENQQQMAEVITLVNQPKTVDFKKSNGQITGATVRPALNS